MLLINKSQTASRDSVAAINTIELFFTSERERDITMQRYRSRGY